MSALPPGADIFRGGSDVRFVPKADIDRLNLPQRREDLTNENLPRSLPIICSVVYVFRAISFSFQDVDLAGFAQSTWHRFRGADRCREGRYHGI